MVNFGTQDKYLDNMKIAIAMPMYNRRNDIAEVIIALSKNDLTDCIIVTSEEPCEEVSSLLDGINFLNIKRHKNPERLGCNGNIVQSLNLAFQEADYVICLEDDIVPGKDFIELYRWYFSQVELTKKYPIITSYNKSNDNYLGIIDIFCKTLVNKVDSVYGFCPWGWGMTKENWESKFNKFEFIDLPSSLTWDLQFAEHLIENDSKILHPVVGRSQNIGSEGTYVPSKEFHEQHQHCKYWIDSYDFPKVMDFEFVK
jgi:hypothetical protein